VTTFAEQAMKVCATCGVDKPEMSYRQSKRTTKRRATCRVCEKAAASPEAKARERESQRSRRQRQALERQQHPVDKPDKPDRASNRGDLERWGAAAFELAGTPPLQHPWEVTCGWCGEVTFLSLTDADARRLSLTLTACRARCQRCRSGWLAMTRGMQSVAEGATDFYRGAWYSPDPLTGPKRERKADAA
jgi:hypothetical protein